MSACNHKQLESVAAAENGLCPLCLQKAWQDEHARATAAWLDKDAAICILKELRDVLLKSDYFDKTIVAIDKYLSGIEPHSGVYEEKKRLEAELNRIKSVLKETGFTIGKDPDYGYVLYDSHVIHIPVNRVMN